MPQSDEDFIKKSKYITDRVLVRAFFQWESFSPHPLNLIFWPCINPFKSDYKGIKSKFYLIHTIQLAN